MKNLKGLCGCIFPDDCIPSKCPHVRRSSVPMTEQVAGFAELADIITKIDLLLARTDETAGYAAFVKMRQAWPKLRVAALRGCADEDAAPRSPQVKEGARQND